MASPFLRDPVDFSVQTELHRERVFRDKQNPLDIPDTYLHEKYRFSAESRIFVNFSSRTLKIWNSEALPVAQTVPAAVQFFESGTYLHVMRLIQT